MVVYQRVIFYFSHISAQKTDKVLTALIALGSVAQAKVSLVVGHAAGHGIDLIHPDFGGNFCEPKKIE